MEVKNWYEISYSKEGLSAQRRWPNEEFCRFMGRNFFSLTKEERLTTKILEVGCGTGANIRLLAEEGFKTYGMDLSEEALNLLPKLVKNMNNVSVQIGDMSQLDYKESMFDAVVDIFSSHCLNTKKYIKFVNSVYNILKKGGCFLAMLLPNLQNYLKTTNLQKE